MLQHLLLRKMLPESRRATKDVIIYLFEKKKTELFVGFVPKRKCKWCVKDSEKEKEKYKSLERGH